MLATLISIIFSWAVLYFPLDAHVDFFLYSMLLGLALFSLPPILYLGALRTLKKSEESSFLEEDRLLKLLMGTLALAPLFLLLPWFLRFSVPLVILLSGISIDLFLLFVRRLTAYFNVGKMLDKLRQRVLQAWQRKDLKEWQFLVTGLSQKILQSLEKGAQPLTQQRLDTLFKMEADVLDRVKSPADESTSFSMGLYIENISLIIGKIFELKNAFAMDYTLALLSKMVLKTARVDFNLALVPLHYVKTWTLEAIGRFEGDTGIKLTLALVEVFKEIAALKDFKERDAKSLFVPLITTLEEIAKEMFKKNKSIKIALLKAPFLEMGIAVESPPFDIHPDTPLLKQQLRRILDEFTALETVMLTVPPPR